jgi:RND family efflux transporter MFP subunit
VLLLGIGVLFSLDHSLIAADPVPADQPEPAMQTTERTPAASAPELASAAAATQHLSSAAAGEPVLNASGYVIARRATTVSSKTTGKVEAVLVEEGMSVEAGQVLARLDATLEEAQLALAQAEVEAALARSSELDAEIDRARAELDRWRSLHERGMASQSRLDELDAELDTLLSRQFRAGKDILITRQRVAMQRVRLDDQTIRAPFAGTVVRKSAQPGEMISPVSAGGGYTRTGICTIVDMTSLEVEVDVNEAYINRVYPTQPVDIRLTAYPEHGYPGEVLAVIPTADRNKATIRVRLKFHETDDRVLPNMGLQVAFLERLDAGS